MRIKNLNIISFGEIDKVNIKLDEKITLINGKNEAGKSSIASFIRYMLYGFSASRGGVSENQKKKYMPWDADECLGEMSFETDDENTYTAVRKTASKSKNTVFDANNMPYTEENAGDYFLGLSENAYVKTAFIGQKDTVFSDEGELDEAIKNMVYSLDESVDSAKAIKKLDNLRRYYLGKTGKSGEIYELDNTLEELKSEREKWKDGHKELLSSEYQLSEISKKLSFNKSEKEKLEREKKNLEAKRAKDLLQKINLAKKTVEDGKSEFEAHYKSMQKGAFVPDEEFAKDVEARLSLLDDTVLRLEECEENVLSAREGLDSIYSDELLKEIFYKLSNENKTPNQLKEEIQTLKKKKKTSLILSLVLLVTVAGFVIFITRFCKLSKQLKAICNEYGTKNINELEDKLASGKALKAVEENARKIYNNSIEACNEEKNKLEQIKQELCELLEKTGTELDRENGDIKSDAKKYLEAFRIWYNKHLELSVKCREEYAAFNMLVSSNNLDELKLSADAFDENIPLRDEKTVSQQLNFYTQAIDALTLKERELEKKTAVLSGTLPKPSEIQSKILSLNEKRAEMVKIHSALSLAVTCLEEASERMKKEASPVIASKTSELFSDITDGKYKGLYADSNMGLTFLQENDAKTMDAGYLSAGTLDAAYISLRVALCEVLYKEKPTLVFDDAFAFLDDERLKKTVNALVKLSEKFQIIILSCHDRERKLLEGKAKIIDFEV